ncbi:uncharacterized protein C5orf49 homolog [Epinephelus fuscoguttatus]|uniref:uncharacterized protein C5orf49 homolog n=1 Tax=Epinephelus fuscoguttatus TaxID=293821 RepID=UPI0020D1EE19|nr:uncharacterized protein C5orf49 homolog [Epinephelus fuscoguttatus]
MDLSEEVNTRPLCALSAFSYISPRWKEAKEMSYFNTGSKAPQVSTNDQILPPPEGYDPKLTRDNRKHYKGRGLHIYEEEKSRAVPLRASSEYGRHPVLEEYRRGQRYPRVCKLNDDTHRTGIVWSESELYGPVAPEGFDRKK